MITRKIKIGNFFYSHSRSIQNIAHHLQSLFDGVISERGNICMSFFVNKPSSHQNLPHCQEIEESENLSEILGSGAFHYLPQSNGQLLLQCKICRDFVEAFPSKKSNQNSISNGYLFESNSKKLYETGGNQSFYSFKNNILLHFKLKSNPLVHKAAIDHLNSTKITSDRSLNVMKTLIGTAILLVKQKNSASAYEDFVYFLASRNVDVGDQSHGR